MTVPDLGQRTRRRRVLFITGTRADYGKLKPIIRAVEDDADLDCAIFATGMHLLEKYGGTWKEIEKDGFSSVFLHFNQDQHTGFMMDRVLADTVRGLSHYVAEHDVDLIVVHGDRIEALAGSLVGALNKILVAHIEGGELSGTIDELLRHTITKMSHLHFVSHQEARDRVIRMGEYPDRVFVIGSANIDTMLSDDLPPIDRVRSYYDLPRGQFALFVLHPVVGENDGIYEATAGLLDSLISTERHLVAIYPNNDPGSTEILRALKERAGSPFLRLLPSMKFEAYLVALRHAAIMIGNSSSGIHEAPVYGVPSINIGSRQNNRFAHSSIVNVPFDAATICEYVDKLWGKRLPTSQHFGSGASAPAFIEVLKDPLIWQTTVFKQFTDH